MLLLSKLSYYPHRLKGRLRAHRRFFYRGDCNEKAFDRSPARHAVCPYQLHRSGSGRRKLKRRWARAEIHTSAPGRLRTEQQTPDEMPHSHAHSDPYRYTDQHPQSYPYLYAHQHSESHPYLYTY